MIVVIALVLLVFLFAGALVSVAFFVNFWFGVSIVMGLALAIGGLASWGYWQIYGGQGK